MNRTFTYIIGIVSLLMIACTGRNDNLSEEEPTLDTIPHIVTQVRKCSKLYTAEYKVHKIITHDDEVRIKGKLLKKDYDITLPIGSRKVAIPMDATIKAYINFDGFSERNIRRQGEKIEIILPDPHIEITSTRINHDEIRKYVAVLRSNFSDKELSNYELQGREAIIKDIPYMGITEMARTSAAKIIIPLLTSIGFDEKDVTVTFQKDLTKEDVRKMIDPTTIIEGK